MVQFCILYFLKHFIKFILVILLYVYGLHHHLDLKINYQFFAGSYHRFFHLNLIDQFNNYLYKSKYCFRLNFKNYEYLKLDLRVKTLNFIVIVPDFILYCYYCCFYFTIHYSSYLLFLNLQIKYAVSRK